MRLINTSDFFAGSSLTQLLADGEHKDLSHVEIQATGTVSDHPETAG